MKNTYTPHPVETDDIQLSPELMELRERLAENVHEVWAQSRLSEGWTYGPARDDVRKQTPCLVPYSDLPEEEKAYDRNTAFETVRFILAKGFRIVK